jgi:hypothetical protein
LQGIASGFDIIQKGAVPDPVELDNHKSASPGSPSFAEADKQVRQEIANGNYILAESPPTIVSPLGAIPKADGGVRLIHDCSRPAGKAVNDYAGEVDRQKFQSVDDAARLVGRGYYMAKVDLKSAYRSVGISTHSQSVTGLKWIIDGTTKYFYDSKLPFGSKLAPGIFHRLSQAMRRMLARQGIFNIVCYLDDFFICEPTFRKCINSLNSVISLLRKLGFSINWKKVVDPTKQIVFLGIEIDSESLELRLPQDKLCALRSELHAFKSKVRANKKQLQSLVGKLNFAASVVHGGRVFLRNLINAIGILKHDSHKIRLEGNLLADIHWWISFMETFNGKSVILQDSPISAVYTDACTEGSGGFWGDFWFYCNWGIDWPQAKDFHINEKEVLAVVIAAHLWGAMWRDHKVIVFSDNKATVACINKGTSRNDVLMNSLRYLFWHSATHNYHLKAVHIPGKNNVKADVISRLHDPISFWSILNPMCVLHNWRYPYQCISPKSVAYLFHRFRDHADTGAGFQSGVY